MNMIRHLIVAVLAVFVLAACRHNPAIPVESGKTESPVSGKPLEEKKMFKVEAELLETCNSKLKPLGEPETKLAFSTETLEAHKDMASGFAECAGRHEKLVKVLCANVLRSQPECKAILKSKSDRE